MTSIVKQTLPEGVSLEILDAVSDEMNVEKDPPKGMIVHTHYSEAGKVHIFDVWENESDYRDFAQHRLGPAMATVAARIGMTPPGGPSGAPMDVVDVHRVVRGR
jgi:hypothetical protein